MRLTRSFATLLCVLAFLMVALPEAALADQFRVTTLAGLDWIIDDELNCFLNPASSAWLGQGILTVNGLLDEAVQDGAGRYRYLRGEAQVLLPTSAEGSPHPNVFGGRVTLFRKKQPVDSDGTFQQTAPSFLVQDGYGVTDWLAVGGSFAFQPKPLEFEVNYPNGDVLDFLFYKKWAFTSQGGVSLRLGHLALVDFVGFTGMDYESTETFWNGVSDGSYTLNYKSSGTRGRLQMAPAPGLKLTGTYEASRTRQEYDGVYSGEARYFEPRFGFSYQPSDKWLIAGGFSPSSEVYGRATEYRGAIEFSPNRAWALRAGAVYYRDDPWSSCFESSTGFEYAAGPWRVATVLIVTDDSLNGFAVEAAARGGLRLQF